MLRCVLTQTFLEDPSLRGGLVDASRNSRRCQRRPTCKGTAGITPYFRVRSLPCSELELLESTRAVLARGSTTARDFRASTATEHFPIGQIITDDFHLTAPNFLLRHRH